MLTKNFYNTLAASGAYIALPDVIKATDGKTYTYYALSTSGTNGPTYFCGMHLLSTSQPNGTAGVMIGTGKTPATPDDFILESPVLAGVTINNQSAVSYIKDDSGIHLCATYGVQNTGSDPLEISEIGCFGAVKISTSGTSSAPRSFLAERTVLETPVVIPAGESRQITYTISFRYPK